MAIDRPLFSDLPGQTVEPPAVAEPEETPTEAPRKSPRRFGLGHARTDAESDARRERLTRIGRLCQPPFGTCLSNAATRELVFTVVDPDTQQPVSGADETVTVIACASHAKRWREKTPWVVVRSETQLPPQEKTPGVPRFPARIVLALAVIDVDPATGEDLPGATPYEVQCQAHKFKEWIDNKNVRIISRAQLPTEFGLHAPTLYTLVIQDVGPPESEPYTVVCWGRREVASYSRADVRILSVDKTPAAVSEDESDGRDD